MLGTEHPATAQRLETRGLATLSPMPDAKEGATAFREKAPPPNSTANPARTSTS